MYANIIPVCTNEETLHNITVFITTISISRLLLSRARLQNKKVTETYKNSIYWKIYTGVTPRIEDKQFQLYQG